MEFGGKQSTYVLVEVQRALGRGFKDQSDFVQVDQRNAWNERQSTSKFLVLCCYKISFLFHLGHRFLSIVFCKKKTNRTSLQSVSVGLFTPLHLTHESGQSLRWNIPTNIIVVNDFTIITCKIFGTLSLRSDQL